MHSFSIIIPVYNSALYIKKCIDSCLAQTYPLIEIICVDDSSIDDSASIIDSYVSQDSRVKLIRHQANMSQTIARLTGIKNATKEYVLFLDSDDYLDKDACFKLNSRLIKNPVDILQFGYIERPGNKKVFPEKILEKDERIKALLRSHNRYSPAIWTCAYKKNILDAALARITPFRATLAEDVLLSVVIAHNADSFGFFKKCLVYYSIGTGTTTQKKLNNDILIDNLKNYKIVSDNVQDYIMKYCPEYSDGLFSMRQYFLEDFIRNRLRDRLYEDDANEVLRLLPSFFSIDDILHLLKEQNRKSIIYDYWLSSKRITLAKIKKIVMFFFHSVKGYNAS